MTNDKVWTAARSLVNDVIGAFDMAELDIRACLGNTNAQVMRGHADELRDLLAASPQEAERPGTPPLCAKCGHPMALHGHGCSVGWCLCPEDRKPAPAPAASAQTPHSLERHLGEIWNELDFSAKARLMERGRGLDPIILALRAAPSPVQEAETLKLAVHTLAAWIAHWRDEAGRDGIDPWAHAARELEQKESIAKAIAMLRPDGTTQA